MTEKKKKISEKNVNELKCKWYIIRVQTGKEDHMIRSLHSYFPIMKKNGIKTDEVFKELVVLKKNIVKYVNGKKVEKQQNMYPGYIFANMILTDNVIVALRNFFRANGFGQVFPEPISDAEYQKIVDKINGINKDNKEFAFSIGQRVKINSGSFATMEGNITAIKENERKLEVAVMIFNCETKIEIDFEQVSIIEEKEDK